MAYISLRFSVYPDKMSVQKQEKIMIFKRKIYNELLNWREHGAQETCLLVEGARRIGKSTICEEFGKNEYRSYMLIDFNDASDMIKSVFNLYLNDLDTFFMILSTETGVTLYPHESLIIFDEIQRFPKARQSLKKLVKDGRFDYIETGSLISIRENVDDITIPSEERSIRMYPMDFEEFCMAMHEEKYIEFIKDCFHHKRPLPEAMHHKAMMLYKQYMLVGGMPQSVAKYLKNRRFEEADEIKRDILSLYRNDILKIKESYRSKVLSIYDQIPSFLSMHEKRIRFNNIEENSTYPMYKETFFWLGNSMAANECFNCTDPNIGLSLNEDRTFVKCYLNDTGLLFSHTFTKKEIKSGMLYSSILNDNLSINEGMFFENVVAQELTSCGYPLFFYTRYNNEKKRNDIEIDFLLSNQSKTNLKIYPIEVKSSKRYTTKSLERFIEIYHRRIEQAYIIHPKNLEVKENGIICIPVYMTFCL